MSQVTHRDKSEMRNCVNIEVAVLGSSSLTVRTVSVDVKQHWTEQMNVEPRQIFQT